MAIQFLISCTLLYEMYLLESRKISSRLLRNTVACRIMYQFSTYKVMWRDYTADWCNNNENELISNINAASSTPNCSLDNNSSTIIGLRCVLDIILIIVIARGVSYIALHYFNSHELFLTFGLCKTCEYNFSGQLRIFISSTSVCTWIFYGKHTFILIYISQYFINKNI